MFLALHTTGTAMPKDEWAKASSKDRGRRAIRSGSYFRSDGLSGKKPAKRKQQADNQLVLSHVKMTKKMIEEGRSSNGGWNAKQLALFGVYWPLQPGWQNRIIGTTVSRETYKQFLKLRGATVAKAKGVVIHSKKDSVASRPTASQGKVVELATSVKGTIFEPMICMDCETVWTTDDPHIRDKGRVLCVKCKGMLALLHQYEEMRDELDAGLKQVLETTN
jgi:hypothetical protein